MMRSTLDFFGFDFPQTSNYDTRTVTSTSLAGGSSTTTRVGGVQNISSVLPTSVSPNPISPTTINVRGNLTSTSLAPTLQTDGQIFQISPNAPIEQSNIRNVDLSSGGLFQSQPPISSQPPLNISGDLGAIPFVEEPIEQEPSNLRETESPAQTVKTSQGMSKWLLLAFLGAFVYFIYHQYKNR